MSDDYRPEWDDRKELADVFQSACLFPVTGLSEDFYTALLRVANWGYDQRKQENTDDQDRAADKNPDVAAMLRLARADSYRQGVKDGRQQMAEELAQIVDDTERVRVVLAARRGAGEQAGG